jgi:hypothetical protein
MHVGDAFCMITIYKAHAAILEKIRFKHEKVQCLAKATMGLYVVDMFCFVKGPAILSKNVLALVNE